MSAFSRSLVSSIIVVATMASCTRPSDPGAPASAPSSAAAATPAPAASSSASSPDALSGAAGMKGYGGTFVCEERVYPTPPKPHITWWGWAFTVDAKTKYDEIAKAFPRAERDDAELTLRFMTEGRPTMVISFEDVAAPRNLPKCSEPLPAGAKSRAVVSSMP